MFHANNHFVGMHFFWWFFWVILIISFLGVFEPLPRKRSGRQIPLDILKKKYASGEFTTEEFEERKKVLAESN